jgi:hypothetical protein
VERRKERDKEEKRESRIFFLKKAPPKRESRIFF